MPQPAVTYALSHIFQNIPMPLLELAFKPRQHNTTVEQRIINEVIEKPVLLDTNLIGGKARTIIMEANWEMSLNHIESFGMLGGGIEGSCYLVPPEAREGRNISSVLGVSSYVGGAFNGTGVNYNGVGAFGNTAMNLASEMLGTYTMAAHATMPQITLEGTNIIKFFPELITDGLAVRVMLEYDSEFLNMNTSGIYVMRDFCMIAVKRYIVKELIVSIDETEVVAGMEIGIIKTLVQEYKDQSTPEVYDAALRKLKSAMHYSPDSIGKLMYYHI